MDSSSLYSGPSDVLRTVAVGACAYVALVLMLRISGKRTLSKMNAFDLIVTVSLGSTLASAVLDKSVSLTNAVTALALLITLQFIVTWLSVRWHGFAGVVKSEPALLVREGEFLRGAMRRERVTEEEILASLRSHGATKLEDVSAVVLETDGRLTVIRNEASLNDLALQKPFVRHRN